MRFIRLVMILVGLPLFLSGTAQIPFDLGRLFPAEIAGWKTSGADRIFSRDTLSDYKHESQDILLGFPFRRLHVREYRNDQGHRLVAEIYDMTTTADAYGIFTHGRRGKEIAVGRGAVYGSDFLRFWKGPLYVHLKVEDVTENSERILGALGKQIAAVLPDLGSKPRLLSCLPDGGREEESLRYFHKQVSLNVHYYLADENVLLLDENTEAALAHYKTGWSRTLLLICRYPSAERAREALVRFSRDFFSTRADDGRDLIVEPIDSGEVAAASRVAMFLILVFEAADRDTCRSLVQDTELCIREVFSLK